MLYSQRASNKPKSLCGVTVLSAPSFIPPDISNLQAWWDASDLSTITKDGSDLVSKWDDKTTNGNDLLQATGSNQPLWVDSVQNSKAIIRFDGEDNFMRLIAFASGDLSQPSTIFIVLNQEIGFSKVVYDGALNAGIKRNAYFSDPSSYHNMFSGITMADTTPIGAGFEQITCLFNGLSSTIRVDKIETKSGNANTQTLAGFTIGGNFFETPIEHGNHDIAELLIYNTNVSSDDRASIENYLATKWGL